MSGRRPGRPRRREPLAALEARVPPPVWTLVAGAAMYALHVRAPYAPLWAGARPTVAVALTVLLGAGGFWLALDSLRRFIRRGTWFHPTHPERASTLVLDGAYRWTRNPMYVGLLLMLAAWGAWLGSASPLAVLPAFVAVLTRLQIVPEERALLDRFGGDYARYRDEVRRWIGRR